MKTDKSRKEAVLRAQQSTEKVMQAQEKLLHLKEQNSSLAEQSGSADPPQLHESPRNLMQSWHNLRSLDQDLAENRYSDLADNGLKAGKTDEDSWIFLPPHQP